MPQRPGSTDAATASGVVNPGRRRFLQAGSVAVAGALLPFGCRTTTSGRPNLLLILTDDQSFDAIGYASRGFVRTPNLDELAARGTIFDAAYCNAMPCTPSRGTIMSGLHWHRWTPLNKAPSDNLEPGHWTWAHSLRESGYDTGMIGKMHFRPMRADHGFSHEEYCEHQFRRVITPGQSPQDDYQRWLAQKGLADPHTTMQPWRLDPELHPISWVRDRAIHYLESRSNADRPFSLTVSFRYPHPPFDPPRSFARLYDPASIQIPTDHWQDMQGMPAAMRRFDGVGFFPRESKSTEFLQRRFAYYYALVTQVDEAVGEIVKHVDLENTLVVFTSDHGVYFGRRGRIGKSPMIPFDVVARIPMFACGYGVPRQVRRDDPVGLVDLAPTFLTAAGIEVPDALDGEPLQRYFSDESYGGDRSLFSWGVNGYNMTRQGAFKYFRGHPSRYSRGASRSDEMLFDLSTDPGELRNLASDSGFASTRTLLAEALDAVEKRPAPDLPRFGAS